MAAGPIEQFEIHKIVNLGDVHLPLIGTVNLAITNSTVAMTLAFGLVVLAMSVVTARAQVVPGRTQMAGEMVFGMVDDLVDNLIGHEGRRSSPSSSRSSPSSWR